MLQFSTCRMSQHVSLLVCLEDKSFLQFTWQFLDTSAKRKRLTKSSMLSFELLFWNYSLQLLINKTQTKQTAKPTTRPVAVFPQMFLTWLLPAAAPAPAPAPPPRAPIDSRCFHSFRPGEGVSSAKLSLSAARNYRIWAPRIRLEGLGQGSVV